MSIKRAEVIGLMRGAFKRGQSASSFFADMRVKGLTYRRTVMLSDWRAENEIAVKEDRIRYVRKDYYPTEKSIAQVPYELSQEYMYKVRVTSRIEPGVPITERFVNLMSDVPMTPAMVEQAVIEKWAEWEDYTAEQLGELVVTTAYRRVE